MKDLLAGLWAWIRNRWAWRHVDRVEWDLNMDRLSWASTRREYEATFRDLVDQLDKAGVPQNERGMVDMLSVVDLYDLHASGGR